MSRTVSIARTVQPTSSELRTDMAAIHKVVTAPGAAPSRYVPGDRRKLRLRPGGTVKGGLRHIPR
jgi:hypothetical protein